MAPTRSLLLGVVVSVGAILLLAWTTDLGQAAARLADGNLAWLLPGLAVLAIQAWIRAERWATLLRPRFGASIRVARVVDAMLAGYFVNAVAPGRLGEVARAVLVSRREAVPFAGVAATVVIERAIDLMALALLLTIALAAAGAWSWALPALAIAGGILAVLALGRRASTLERLIPAQTPVRLAGGAREFLRSIEAMPPSANARAAVLSAAAWLGDTILVLLVSRALDVDIPLAAAVAIGLGGSLGTALPAAPGYLGTYELGAVTVGGLAGVASESVLPVAVLTHVLGVTVLAAAGALLLGRVGGGIRLETLRRPDALAAGVDR